MSTEEEANIATVRRGFAEIWNGRDWSVAGELYSDDLVVHSPDGDMDLEGFRQQHTMLQGAFPDFVINLEDIFAEGDRVAIRWIMRGTHQGPFFGVPGSGKTAAVEAFEIFRFENGKLRELWVMPNSLSAMQQIGAIPPGPPPKAMVFMMQTLDKFKRRKATAGR